LRRLIREHGKCALKPETRRSPFQSLVQAVAHQQLNGTAANTILRRFKKLVSRQKFPRPEDLAKVTDAQIRACGFSFAKIKAIRDIAEKPCPASCRHSRQIVKLSDDEIIARLTEVRGVGRWTVEMLLIFQLGRRCLPADDFGVRTGFRLPTKSANAEAEGTARVRRKMAAASHHGGVVSLARGGCGQEKEVTARRFWL
jgi:DNA-3-methyladenine glycosylase II